MKFLKNYNTDAQGNMQHAEENILQYSKTTQDNNAMFV